MAAVPKLPPWLAALLDMLLWLGADPDEWPWRAI